MPRYFLNIRDGDDLIEDLAGDDYADVTSAKREAVDRARMVAEMGRFERPTQQIEVCNAARVRVASVRVADQMRC